MELRALIVTEDVTGLEEQQFGLYIIKTSWENFRNGRTEEVLAGLGIGLNEVLLLCPADEWVLMGKASGIATLAYATEGSSYSFPNASYVVEGIEHFELEDYIKRYQREHRLPWVISTTERLIIREEVPEDAERLQEIYESPSVKRYLLPLFELEQEKKYLADYYKYIYSFYEYGLWHLELRDSHYGIGRAGLTPKQYDDGEQGAELGYVLDEKYQGQGYCMEACREILRYATEELEMDKVYCLIRPDNFHSIRICEKLGFVFDKEMNSEDRIMKRYVKMLKDSTQIVQK